MTDSRKILVVGGYGIFGGRLVDLLLDEPRLTLIVSGRSHDRAMAFCASRASAKACLLPASFDRQGDITTQLSALDPDVCVDASGPFQGYGDGRYRLIEACIAQGVDYLDLADGSDFVAGVSGFDAAAKTAGVFVLSGVSSFPVLTAAVARLLSAGMAHVTSIKGGIAPSPYAGVGENVIRAIASYAGRPVAIRRDGANVIGHPFTETLHFTIAPPGLVPLRRTLFSLVDVPDLRVLADLWPDARDVWMGAGPVPKSLHRALIALAWLVRWRLVPSLSFMAPLMYRVTNRLRWGEHRGGMFVEIEGEKAGGEPVKRSWHLLAEGDDGPLIPSMAIEAIVRKALAGKRPSAGARAAVHELELSDYESLFARRNIGAGIREDVPRERTSLYAQVLGSAWNDLPIEIRAMHDGRRANFAIGRCAVQRGSSMLSRLAARLFGFPAAGDDLPVTVSFKVDDDGEAWTRTFGGKSFASRLRQGTGGAKRLLCECFGPLEFAQALVVDRGGLRLVLRRWTVFGIPLPLSWGPRSSGQESVEEGRYRFFVEIGHPLTGLIVRYQGWLGEPRESGQPIMMKPASAPAVKLPS